MIEEKTMMITNILVAKLKLNPFKSLENLNASGPGGVSPDASGY